MSAVVGSVAVGCYWFWSFLYRLSKSMDVFSGYNTNDGSIGTASE